VSARVVTWEHDLAPLGRAVVAMGVFDGVHVGHQALIAHAVVIARTRDVAACVLTFDRDPDLVVTPDSAAPQLLTLAGKIAALDELGPDIVLIVPFDVHLSAMSPTSFLDNVLLAATEPLAVVVGCDFRFGARASGDATVLAEYGLAHGFDAVLHELVEVDGAPVTSTRVRALVGAGDVAGAARLLGRPHRVTGHVAHGRGQGRVLGAPTVNLMPIEHAALPADGVYAGRAITPAGTFLAGISVGVPPMFPEAIDHLEAHLLDFSGDLYGATVTLEFVERLRDQRRFATPEVLAQAIEADLVRVREIVR
jgi:riboflavin kinase / FMN adenylyltransferase